MYTETFKHLKSSDEKSLVIKKRVRIAMMLASLGGAIAAIILYPAGFGLGYVVSSILLYGVNKKPYLTLGLFITIGLIVMGLTLWFSPFASVLASFASVIAYWPGVASSSSLDLVIGFGIGVGFTTFVGVRRLFSPTAVVGQGPVLRDSPKRSTYATDELAEDCYSQEFTKEQRAAMRIIVDAFRTAILSKSDTVKISLDCNIPEQLLAYENMRKLLDATGLQYKIENYDGNDLGKCDLSFSVGEVMKIINKGSAARNNPLIASLTIAHDMTRFFSNVANNFKEAVENNHPTFSSPCNNRRESKDAIFKKLDSLTNYTLTTDRIGRGVVKFDRATFERHLSPRANPPTKLGFFSCFSSDSRENVYDVYEHILLDSYQEVLASRKQQVQPAAAAAHPTQVLRS